jgi:hypothetical protein
MNKCNLKVLIVAQWGVSKVHNDILYRAQYKEELWKIFGCEQFKVIKKVTKSASMVCDMLRYQALFKMQIIHHLSMMSLNNMDL